MSLNTEVLFYSRYLIDLQYISQPSSGALKWKNNDSAGRQTWGYSKTQLLYSFLRLMLRLFAHF